MNGLIVTTSYKPDVELVNKAKQTALSLEAVYKPREGSSLAKLQQRFHVQEIVVVRADGVEWHHEETAFFFHPGMSLVRAKRLSEGGNDVMLEAARFEPGDSVLDCTAGLCSDSIVFSFVGGPASTIVALESERPLHFIVSQGLQTYDSDWPLFNAALRRIEVKQADHTEYLRSLPDKSIDIVYFDPMFRSPVRASSGISPLRRFANTAELHAEAIHEARRVARKSIVLKERPDAPEWENFGFAVVTRPNAAAVYGVIYL